MNYIFVVLIGIFSVIAVKLFMKAGEASIAEFTEYEPIVGILEKLRSFMGQTKFRWPIVAAVNLLCGIVLAGYYEADLVSIVNTVVLLAMLWACSAYDMRYEIIPNNVLLAGGAVRAVILVSQILMHTDELAYYLVNSFGAAIALLVTGIICRLVSRDSVGMGDVKLLGVTGFYLGVDGAFYTVMASIIVLFILAVALLITKKADRSTAIPFAPFLLAGLVVAVIGYGVY